MERGLGDSEAHKKSLLQAITGHIPSAFPRLLGSNLQQEGRVPKSKHASAKVEDPPGVHLSELRVTASQQQPHQRETVEAAFEIARSQEQQLHHQTKRAVELEQQLEATTRSWEKDWQRLAQLQEHLRKAVSLEQQRGRELQEQLGRADMIEAEHYQERQKDHGRIEALELELQAEREEAFIQKERTASYIADLEAKVKQAFDSQMQSHVEQRKNSAKIAELEKQLLAAEAAEFDHKCQNRVHVERIAVLESELLISVQKVAPRFGPVNDQSACSDSPAQEQSRTMPKVRRTRPKLRNRARPPAHDDILRPGDASDVRHTSSTHFPWPDSMPSAPCDSFQDEQVSLASMEV